MTGEGRDRARRIQNAGTEGNQQVAGGAGRGTSSTFQGCVWPPVPGSDISGFWEVRVRDFVIPNSFDAKKFTDIQIFDTT